MRIFKLQDNRNHALGQFNRSMRYVMMVSVDRYIRNRVDDKLGNLVFDAVNPIPRCIVNALR